MRLLTAFVFSLCLSVLSAPLFAADGEPVNINTADAKALSQALTGVGQSKAEAIVAYRETYGSFEAVEELEAVKGIGPAIIAKNRDQIVLQ